ncbi:cytochrome c oxidase assembly protein COX16 homolog l(3)neo43 [Augochlora pura]
MNFCIGADQILYRLLISMYVIFNSRMSRISKFINSTTFRYFIPFMVLVIGGSFALREITEVRYKYRKSTTYDIKRDIKKAGITMKESIPLEEIYEDLQKNSDLDDWKNVRIPRPWEEK